MHSHKPLVAIALEASIIRESFRQKAIGMRQRGGVRLLPGPPRSALAHHHKSVRDSTARRGSSEGSAAACTVYRMDAPW